MIANRTIREGIVAGLLAAAAVAVWFFFVDLVAGHPLGTPAMLGESVASLFGGTGGGSLLAYTALYTVFHVIAFIVSGIIVSAVVNGAEQEPSLLFGLLILFVAFEIGWYGWTALLARDGAYGSLAWYQVMAANLVAALAMGAYLYRRHPSLVGRAAHAFDQTA